jgi:kynureninase
MQKRKLRRQAMGIKFSTDESWATQKDEADTLKCFKNRFYLLKDSIYMDGNSLGLMSVDAESSLMRVMEEWKTLGINGWMGGETPWFYYPEMLAGKLAGLIGAEKDEVMIHSSTTINLHLLLATFYRPEGNRTKVLMDNLTFPSDRYAVESFMKT